MSSSFILQKLQLKQVNEAHLSIPVFLTGSSQNLQFFGGEYSMWTEALIIFHIKHKRTIQLFALACEQRCFICCLIPLECIKALKRAEWYCSTYVIIITPFNQRPKNSSVRIQKSPNQRKNKRAGGVREQCHISNIIFNLCCHTYSTLHS